jgi:hypothetical protein
VHTSDCDTIAPGKGLVCALGFCVSQCNQSVDCTPATDLCVKTDTGNVCRAPELAKPMTCVMNSDCSNFCADPTNCPIICGRDLTCRTQCKTAVDCPSTPGHTQVCTKSGACADPKVDMDYNMQTNDFNLPDGGASDASGTAGTGTAGAGGTAGGSSGTAGTAGAGGSGGTPGTAGSNPDGSAGTRTDAAAGTGMDAGNPETPEVVMTTTVMPNAQVHQGQSGVKITFTKSDGGLSNPTVVSFGALDKSKAVVQSTSTDTSLVISVNVPHGAPLGKQTLVVSTAGGVITATDVIEITAITAGPMGSDSNSGTASSPFRSFTHAITLADVGDTVHIMDGTYSAASVAMGGSEETWNAPINENVTIVGDSVAGTILDGAGGPTSADAFDAPATFSVSNLTVKHFRYGIYINKPNSTISMQHLIISSSLSYGMYIDTMATGSTITLSGADSLIDEPTTQTAIYLNGNQSVSNAKITLNLNDGTIQAGYTVVSIYNPSGTTLNVTGATLKQLGPYDTLAISQGNNVIGNTITLKNATVIGTMNLNDKTLTLSSMGGTFTQKNSNLININQATSVNLNGTKLVMNDGGSYAINLQAPNAAMTLSDVTITSGSAGVSQSGMGSTAKLRNTEILSPQNYAYYLTAGNLDLGTATDVGGNGLGLPISTSYYSLYVYSSSSVVTSNGTTYGDKLDAMDNVIKGVVPGMAVVVGQDMRGPQIYYVSAGSMITFSE